ncbi:MAG: hypothetical protein AB1894_07270 [Chloroflexota bacterium]
MEIVAGLSLSNRHPKVWNENSPYFLQDLKAVMVSYGDFFKSPTTRKKAMDEGLHTFLEIPDSMKIYLDNGAFYFLRNGSGEVPRNEYEEFVAKAKPDWYAIPQDYIPSPRMSDEEQKACLFRTMAVNRQYQRDGYVPIVHISRFLQEYLEIFKSEPRLMSKPTIGLGGIVPNLLRAPKAMPYQLVLDQVRQVRSELRTQGLHVFGIGGTATLHLAALLGIDSVDSSGWRNRAARGIVQLPGRGDRITANLGSWRGREPTNDEWEMLDACKCPACVRSNVDGLKRGGLEGFCLRATHNLWTLLKEAEDIESHLQGGTYKNWYISHVENSTYRPLIDYLLTQG